MSLRISNWQDRHVLSHLLVQGCGHVLLYFYQPVLLYVLFWKENNTGILAMFLSSLFCWIMLGWVWCAIIITQCSCWWVSLTHLHISWKVYTHNPCLSQKIYFVTHHQYTSLMHCKSLDRNWICWIYLLAHHCPHIYFHSNIRCGICEDKNVKIRNGQGYNILKLFGWHKFLFIFS